MHLHALSHASRCACIPTPWEAAQTFGTGPGGPGAAHACHLHSSAWLAGRPFNADAHVSPSAARPAWDRVGNGSRCGELQAGGGGGGELSTSCPSHPMRRGALPTPKLPRKNMLCLERAVKLFGACVCDWTWHAVVHGTADSVPGFGVGVWGGGCPCRAAHSVIARCPQAPTRAARATAHPAASCPLMAPWHAGVGGLKESLPCEQPRTGFSPHGCGVPTRELDTFRDAAHEVRAWGRAWHAQTTFVLWHVTTCKQHGKE